MVFVLWLSLSYFLSRDLFDAYKSHAGGSVLIGDGAMG